MNRLFRKGDRVSIMGTIEHSQDEGETVCVKVDSHYASIFLAPEIVTLICPRILPGERVFNEDGEIQGVVRAVHDDLLWVQHSEGYDTWRAASVTVIDPSTIPQLEAAE